AKRASCPAQGSCPGNSCQILDVILEAWQRTNQPLTVKTLAKNGRIPRFVGSWFERHDPFRLSPPVGADHRARSACAHGIGAVAEGAAANADCDVRGLLHHSDPPSTEEGKRARAVAQIAQT